MTILIDCVQGCGTISVQSDGGGGNNYYTPDPNIPLDGMLRTNNGTVEYYNGSAGGWYQWIGVSLNISLYPALQDAMFWAIEEQGKAAQLEEKMKKFPSLRQAKDNFDMVKALVENDK